MENKTVNMRWRIMALVPLLLSGTLNAAPPVPGVTPVPEAVRTSWQLDDFYQKHVDVGGFPVISSAEVSDYALREAAYLIDQLLDTDFRVLH